MRLDNPIHCGPLLGRTRASGRFGSGFVGDRVFLITVGSRGLGFAAAQALVAEGARVVLSATRDAALSTAAALPELAMSNGLFPGVAGVVKMLAEELGPTGIRMNGILPVRIATDRVRRLDAVSGDPDEVRARRSQDIPLLRYGEPEEFGRLAAFLLSPQPHI
jgi:3-oxoacyl-[acyl-carrier protein] reductase